MYIALHTSGKKFIIKDTTRDFPTPYGVIKTADLKESNCLSSTKEEFTIYHSDFIDIKEQFHKGPQIMLPKDVGLIIAQTGIDKTWNIVDAGAGAGGCCLQLARISNHVTVYDIKKRHLQITKNNAEIANITNIIVTIPSSSMDT